MVLGWNVPVGPSYCNSQGQPVSCDMNNVVPLKPNYDVVSKAVSSPTLIKISSR